MNSPGAAAPCRLARVALAAALPLVVAGAALAECRGRDVFPDLKAKAPEVYEAITQTAAALPFARGKLFRIVRPGREDSYLFGTIHVADQRVTEFSPGLRQTIARSRTVALELKEAGALNDPALLGQVGLALLAGVLARNDERPDRLLSPGDFSRLETAVERRGWPVSAARTFKPTVLALVITTPECALAPGEKPFVDAHVARIAAEHGIRVVGLETISEQIAVLAGLGPDPQRRLLLSSLDLTPYGEDIIATTLARYEGGEIGLLLAWMKSARPVPGLADAAPPPEFFSRILDDRNRRMRDRALPLLEEGGAFIAVGAAHLPGDNGLARLIESAGYAIEPVQDDGAR